MSAKVLLFKYDKGSLKVWSYISHLVVLLPNREMVEARYQYHYHYHYYCYCYTWWWSSLCYFYQDLWILWTIWLIRLLIANRNKTGKTQVIMLKQRVFFKPSKSKMYVSRKTYTKNKESTCSHIHSPSIWKTRQDFSPML